jgi:hypothetical protein
MALFTFNPRSLNWYKPFMFAEWSVQTADDGVYVQERLVGIGSRRRGPMSADEARRFVEDRRVYVGELQRSIAVR